ncbi:MAG TPA: Spy/CpxP family protein refolding chaperone [Blastocatellia bacterium]
MKKFSLFILLIALAATASAFAQRRINQGQRNPRIFNPQRDQRPFPRKNQPPFGPGQKAKAQQMLMQAIGLTDSQRMRMAEIRRSNEDNVLSAERRFRQARNALDRTIMSEEYDEKLINQRIEEFVAAQSEATRQRARVRAQLRSVLTTEQIVRFRELEREWMQKQRELREQRQQDRQQKGQDQKDKDDEQALLGPGLEVEEEDFVTWLLFGV